MALKLTKDNFKQEVLEANVPVLVDFWAQWCGPCRMVGPFVEQVAEEYEGKAKVGKVDIDEQTELAQQYQVMTIPTLMVFKNGEIVDTIVGAVPKATLKQMLDKHL